MELTATLASVLRRRLRQTLLFYVYLQFLASANLVNNDAFCSSHRPVLTQCVSGNVSEYAASCIASVGFGMTFMENAYQVRTMGG